MSASPCVGMRCIAPTLECARCVVGVVGLAVAARLCGCVCCGGCQVLKVLEGHTDWVFPVAISADGSRIVSGSADKTVRIWSAESGQVPHRSAPCLSWLGVCVCVFDAGWLHSLAGSLDLCRLVLVVV